MKKNIIAEALSLARAVPMACGKDCFADPMT
jgi:hypothetical protein